MKILNFLELIFASESSFIHWFQIYFNFAEKYFIRVSELADPAYAFTIIFPIASILSSSLGSDILLVSVMAEWSNILLKWLLREGRPYWWVKENDITWITLKQTKLTCETGPGSPSGHCMSAAAVGFVLVQWLCKEINEKTLIGRVYKRRLNRGLWIIYWILLFNVLLSRLFHATHFPHQCLFGIIGGLFINYLFSNDSSRITKWCRKARKLQLVMAASLLLIISVGAYWFQRLLGIDPQWSIRLAFKWCSSPDYLHVNTTPMYSLVRVCGAAFGIALSSPLLNPTTRSYNKLICAILTFLVCWSIQLSTKEIPTVDYKLYYSCMFMIHTIQPYFILKVVPVTASLISKIKRD